MSSLWGVLAASRSRVPKYGVSMLSVLGIVIVVGSISEVYTSYLGTWTLRNRMRNMGQVLLVHFVLEEPLL